MKVVNKMNNNSQYSENKNYIFTENFTKIPPKPNPNPNFKPPSYTNPKSKPQTQTK